MPALGLGGTGAGKQVGRRDEAAVNLVGLARLHGLEREVGVRVENHADIGRILVQADDLVLQLRTELLPTEAEVAERVAHITEQLATGNVEIAGDGLERDDRVT